MNFTKARTKNTYDDNAKQLATSIDQHYQDWADLQIKSVKEGAELPPRPTFDQILAMSRLLLQAEAGPAQPQQQPNMTNGGV